MKEKEIIMNDEFNTEAVENKKTVIVKVDPFLVSQNKKMLVGPKVNKVYVVPNSASKKSILKKLNDPTAEIIDASSFYDPNISSLSPQHMSKSQKITKVPFIKSKQKLMLSPVLTTKQLNPRSIKRFKANRVMSSDSSTIHISSVNKDDESEVTEHEISADVGHEISASEGGKLHFCDVEEEDKLIDEDSELASHQAHSLTELQTKPSIMSSMSVRRSKDSEEQIKLAIEDVLKSNMSVKRAAHVYGIRYSVLVSRINKVGSSGKGALGADPALTEKEELVLVEWIKSRYKTGCPVKKIDLINRVADIVSDGRPTRFKEGMPGEKWFLNFVGRNPSVATLGPTTRCDSRETPSKPSLMSWFKRCENHLHVFGQERLVHDPRRVGSVEELTLCLLSSKTKVANSNGCCEGTLYFPREKSGNITVLLGACADGTLTPPMPVFSCRKPPPALINSIPSGWGIGLSKDGNINKEVVHSYFKNILIPWLAEQDRLPYLLFIDKLKTFLSVDTADYCAQKGLLIYHFFPNSTKVLQPLHRSVIEPVRKSWGALSTHKNDKEALLQFCPTLNQLLFNLAPPFTIVESFRACGIHPFDSKAPDYSKCLLVRENKRNKNFSSNDYAIALEVFEDLIGKAKTEIFKETLKGFKLLKSEDGALFSIWHKLVSKVDVTRDCSEPEEYKHEKIIRGAYKKLPRPEMYLMVVDDGEEYSSLQDYRNFNNDLTQASSSSTSGNANTDPDNPTNPDDAVLEIDNSDESMIKVFPKRKVEEEEEENAGEEARVEPSEHSSAFWKEHYSEGMAVKGGERIKEERRLERKIRRERKMVMMESDEIVSKKLKKAIGPRHCSQCLGGRGKLIKCMVCKSRIHFECMMEEEKQIMSDLYEDHVAFDYICPACS